MTETTRSTERTSSGSPRSERSWTERQPGARQAGDQTQTADELTAQWASDPRWSGIRRDHTAADVIALRGSVREEHTLARRGSERLWDLLHTREWVPALGALTGNQAVQQVRAGLEAIYLSGWQVAADANLSGQTYPDQSLYPSNSVPAVVRRINNALLRATRSSRPSRAAGAPTSGSRRSWPTPRLGSAARSTRTSSWPR